MAAGAAAGTLFAPGIVHAQQWTNQPEKGAQLRVLRWKRFVQGDEDAVHGERQEVHREVRHPGACRSRRLGGRAAEGGRRGEHRRRSGHHPVDERRRATSIRTSCVDVTDVADYLGKKYGGWYPVCQQYLRPDGKKWIGVPLGCAGNALVYRDEPAEGGGLRHACRKDIDGFLQLMKALKDKGTPGGFALGNATGDGNTWTHWLVWAHGGKLVNEKNKVVINSPETIKALEYAKRALRHVRAGHAVVARPEQQQGVPRRPDLASPATASRSTTRRRTRPTRRCKEMEADINHANFPIGPVGRPTEFNLFFNQMIFSYTKYPKAAKEFLRFMMEDEQISPWVTASIGYVTPALTVYEKHKVWSGSEGRAVPRLDEEHAAVRLRGEDGLRVGRRARRLHHRRTWWRRLRRARSRRRMPRRGRRSAPSAITRSDVPIVASRAGVRSPVAAAAPT